MNFKEGETILLYKPRRWSSFDIVKKVKNLIHKHTQEVVKIGHAGTLDPLAEGLMILCTGNKTKELTNLTSDEKEYIATIKFGATTPSFDLETDIDCDYSTEHIDRNLLELTLQNFLGIQEQLPPQFSAKKVNGQRAYKKARRGIEVDIKPVQIELKEPEILSFELPVAEIRILCTKGTYIRTLAHDLGKAMNTGAHLIGLKRTQSGAYKLTDAFTLEEFENKLKTQ
jgi:tRNA pseudouridine55 synthase